MWLMSRWVAVLLLPGCHQLFGLVPVDDAAEPCIADTFTGTELDPRWSIASTTPHIRIRQDDTLTFDFAASGAAATGNSLVSAETLDLRAGSVTVELVEPPSLHRESTIRLSSTVSTYYSIGLRFDQEQASVPRIVAKIDDNTTAIFDRPYDPIGDHWLRIRFEGIQASFETSPDGVTWLGESTLIRSTPDALSVLFNGYITGDATGTEPANAVRWDNLTVFALDCAR